MFGKPGTTELIIVLVIVLVIFGPKALPKLGRSIGKTIGGFKKGLDEDLENEEEEEEEENITDAITLCARKGSRQESLSIGRSHLQEIIAGTIGNGIAEAVHLLIGCGWGESDVLSQPRTRTPSGGVFHFLLPIGSCRIDANRLCQKHCRRKEER